MPYTKGTWTDEVLAGDERYNILTDAGAPIESNVQIALSTTITTPGTSVSAARMNNIENGISSMAKSAISGLQLLWVGNTAITLGTGYAGLPNGSIIDVDTPIEKSALSLSANTWYHVYLYLNAGVPDIEIVTTDPANPYFGTARTKAGETNRRYVGSFVTNSAGNIINFNHVDGAMMYKSVSTTSAPFRVLSNGTSTAATNISLSSIIPLTASFPVVRCLSTGVGTVRTSNDNGLPGTGQILVLTASNQMIVVNHAVSSSMEIFYRWDAAPSGGGLFIDILGYIFAR